MTASLHSRVKSPQYLFPLKLWPDDDLKRVAVWRLTWIVLSDGWFQKTSGIFWVPGAHDLQTRTVSVPADRHNNHTDTSTAATKISQDAFIFIRKKKSSGTGLTVSGVSERTMQQSTVNVAQRHPLMLHWVLWRQLALAADQLTCSRSLLQNWWPGRWLAWRSWRSWTHKWVSGRPELTINYKNHNSRARDINSPHFHV